MELHQLRYVAAVARTGNFSRAAEECHVSQPSLSQQIQKLEGELGERLFDRLKRQTKLTPGGAVFLRRALRILEEVDAAKREATETREAVGGTVAIGALPTIAPYLLPLVTAEFVRRFPTAELIIHEDTTAHLLKLAHACEVDLVLASLPIRDDRLHIQELFSEDLVLALPPGHRLARKRFVDGGDLDDEILIVMKEGHCLGDQTLGFCDSRDLKPRISFRSSQLETIHALVLAGLGISLVPAMAVQTGRRNLPEYRSFVAPRPERKIVALWPKQRAPSRAATEFLNLLVKRFCHEPVKGNA
jgi:LysR family hydrogen peroxide-inducible transcriptional activator